MLPRAAAWAVYYGLKADDWALRRYPGRVPPRSNMPRFGLVEDHTLMYAPVFAMDENIVHEHEALFKSIV